MNLLNQIQNGYLDGNGLVTPNRGKWLEGTGGSDNGPMFTAEFCMVWDEINDTGGEARKFFVNAISRCIGPDGMLHRKPPGQPAYQEQVDDYYAVLAASRYLQHNDFAKGFLKAVVKYKGALNTDNPGQWTANSFLIRQPQLLYAMISIAYPTGSMKDWFIRLLATPLHFYTALVIAASCRNTPTTDTDSRRLAFHLISCCPKGLLMDWAVKGWRNRLAKDYPHKMKDVATIYYEGGHPTALYWPFTE